MYKIVCLQPPSPPFKDVDREFTAGLGQAQDVSRPTWGHSRYPFFNHSLAWTAGILEEAGYDVVLYDGQAEEWDLHEVISHVSGQTPDLLVVLINLPTLFEDLSLIHEIKKRIKELVVVTIGSVCRVFPETIIESGDVDYVSTGEPEATIKPLADCLKTNMDVSKINGLAYKSDGQILLTPADGFGTDLDSIPMIPYQQLPMAKYKGQYFAKGQSIAPIISSRGCPFGCDYYCPYPHHYGKKVRFRSPSKVVDEIGVLVNKYGITNFIFRDQNFTLNSDHASAVCQGIIDKDFKINWVCETRLSLVSDLKLLTLMKEAGCSQINFGLESGDPELFESIGKPGSIFKQIEQATRLAREAGIRAHAHAIIGLPGETWKTIKSSLRLLKGFMFDSVNFSIMTVYPGTKSYQDAKSKGYILTDKISEYSHSNVVVRTEKLSGLELKLAQIWLNYQFGNISLARNLYRKTVRRAKKLRFQMQQGSA